MKKGVKETRNYIDIVFSLFDKNKKKSISVIRINRIIDIYRNSLIEKVFI